MKRPGLLAFGITLGVIVPAGLHLLQAGPREIARLVRPGASTMTVGKAEVKVTTDKGIVAAHGIVHVKLQATAPTRQPVQVTLLVEESRGANGGRVDDPPSTVAVETVELEAGGAPRDYSFKVSGFRGTDMGGYSQFGYYTVLVMTPKDAKVFERARQHAKAGDGTFEESYAAIGQDGHAARLEVRAYTPVTNMQIVAPQSMKVGETFVVRVRYKNDKNDKSEGISIRLGTPDLGADSAQVDSDLVTIEGTGDDAGVVVIDRLKNQATAEVEFKVTAKAPGFVGLSASAYGETKLGDTLEGIEVLPAETPAVAGK